MNISFLVVKHLMLGGGIEKYTREVGSRLARRGHAVTVYSMRHHGPALSNEEGMRVVHVPCLRRASSEKLTAGGIAALRVALSRNKPDVVHLHSVAAGAFAWLLQVRGTPCLLQMHGVEWQRSRWSNFGRTTLRFLEKVSIRQANALTAVSQTQCDFYAREYGVTMSCIPTGAEIKTLMPPREISLLGLKPRQYILFASRLVREKGAHYLIPAFRQMPGDVHLVIAGDAMGEGAYKAELQALAGNDPRIHFVGFVQGRLLEELFSHALLYVQPSEVEGLSIALLEAMSYGNACLVSDIPENREAIGNTGFTFQSRNIPDLAARMATTLHQRHELDTRGQFARTRVQNHFSWDRITDQLEEVYLRLKR